jgi:murein L,D-transpeptidase YafK
MSPFKVPAASMFLVLAFAAAVADSHAETNPYLGLFLGYSKAVNAVAVSPSGRQAASGGKDNFLRLWDLPTGLLLRTFDAETNAINSVAFSADGQRLLTGDNDGHVWLWELASARPVLMMEGHTAEVRAVAFAPDGRRILSASADKTIKLWDASAGGIIQTLEGHSDDVLSAVFSADGRRILSGGKDKTARLWDAESGQLLKTFREEGGEEVTAVALSDDGQYALSAGKDKTIRIWDAATGALQKTLSGHEDTLLSATFSQGGEYILSASRDNTVRLWDVETGTVLKTLDGHGGAVTSAVFAPDGKAALSGSADKTMKLWDLESGTVRSTIDLEAVTFAPSGYRNFFSGVASASASNSAPIEQRLREKGFERGDPIFLRVFKADLALELWVKRAGRFELFATYPICAWSGQLGPKLEEGDGQTPEGFYTIGKSQLNPNSHYHLAVNIGFPNALDRGLKRTGSNIMIHGACASVGCYAMTDAVIDEIWSLITAALNRGQERIDVHVFPFRMTQERLAAFSWHPWAEFWRDLKPAYDLFEQSRVLPEIGYCNNRYVVKSGRTAKASGVVLQSSCPARKEVWQAASH